jgi:hypothetical protein
VDSPLEEVRQRDRPCQIFRPHLLLLPALSALDRMTWRHGLPAGAPQALERTCLDEGFLHRVQRVAIGRTLDGDELGC